MILTCILDRLVMILASILEIYSCMRQRRISQMPGTGLERVVTAASLCNAARPVKATICWGRAMSRRGDGAAIALGGDGGAAPTSRDSSCPRLQIVARWSTWPFLGPAGLKLNKLVS